ncbi:unnamed protein product [Prunus armeniaca]
MSTTYIHLKKRTLISKRTRRWIRQPPPKKQKQHREKQTAPIPPKLTGRNKTEKPQNSTPPDPQLTVAAISLIIVDSCHILHISS